MKQPAIKYEHFVKTRKHKTVKEWLDKLKGNYAFDDGSWRDYAFLQERGIEFELFDDAKKFIFEHGGVYRHRRILD